MIEVYLHALVNIVVLLDKLFVVNLGLSEVALNPMVKINEHVPY